MIFDHDLVPASHVANRVAEVKRGITATKSKTLFTQVSYYGVMAALALHVYAGRETTCLIADHGTPACRPGSQPGPQHAVRDF